LRKYGAICIPITITYAMFDIRRRHLATSSSVMTIEHVLCSTVLMRFILDYQHGCRFLDW
jgi:hypothetical protein